MLGQNMYYSFNNESASLLQEVKNYSEFFDDTLIIGAARNSSGTPFRYVKATISNLVIKTS